MKKTKVVCTMGPNTNDRELLKKLIENGMDCLLYTPPSPRDMRRSRMPSSA